MAKVKIKWNLPGFEEVRRMPELRAELGRHADAIAAASGDGYEANVGEGKSRSRASVVAVTYGARRDNARNNTILRNANAGKR